MTPLPTGFSVGVRRSQVTLTTPRCSSIGQYGLTADEAEALADLLQSAAAVASLQELRASRQGAHRSIEHTLAARKEMDEEVVPTDAAANDSSTSEGEADVAMLARVRRDAELAQILDETARLLAGLAQLVSGGWIGQA